MGRPKKEVVEDSKIVKEEVQEKQTQNNNDMFSPENMAKMFAMFKQFQEMENQSKEVKTNIKNENSNGKFTKVMLSKIEDENVTVKSAIKNVIFKSPKTLIKYKWCEKGDVEVMTIKEILAMENNNKRFLHTPWLIIEDDRVIEALGLEKLYENISKVEDIENLITLPSDEIRAIFESLPNNYKNNFRDEIYMKVKTNELRDIVVINTLNDILGINLMD